MRKVALILYTSGLEYDDRIRKEILTIQSLFPDVQFKIFAVVPENKEASGVTSYGVPYRIPYLYSREKYASGSKTLAKAYDFYKAIKEELEEFDIIWCADIETFIFTLLIKKKPIIWDLHELPLLLMRNFATKIILKLAERRCVALVHANQARVDHLFSVGAFRIQSKHFVLNNFPSFNEIDSEYDELYEKFVSWKGNSLCVYLQGLNGVARADIESIQAVMAIPELKAVVVGGFTDATRKKLHEMYGEKFDNRIFFTGKIKQLKTPQYIKVCVASLVFYKNTSPNNYYCEPNRMYQNVINGNPIVVGNNPPMRSFVEKWGCGVVVDSDGSDVCAMTKGLYEVLSNYEQYRERSLLAASHILWESQNDTIKEIFGKVE